MSSSVPPFLLTFLRWYVNSFTSLIHPLQLTDTTSPPFVPIQLCLDGTSLSSGQPLQLMPPRLVSYPSYLVFCATVGPDYPQNQGLVRMSEKSTEYLSSCQRLSSSPNPGRPETAGEIAGSLSYPSPHIQWLGPHHVQPVQKNLHREL